VPKPDTTTLAGRRIYYSHIDGDGWKELTIYRAKDGGTQIEIFKFNGRRLKKVLSAYKAGYN